MKLFRLRYSSVFQRKYITTKLTFLDLPLSIIMQRLVIQTRILKYSIIASINILMQVDNMKKTTFSRFHCLLKLTCYCHVKTYMNVKTICPAMESWGSLGTQIWNLWGIHLTLILSFSFKLRCESNSLVHTFSWRFLICNLNFNIVDFFFWEVDFELILN